MVQPACTDPHRLSFQLHLFPAEIIGSLWLRDRKDRKPGVGDEGFFTSAGAGVFFISVAKSHIQKTIDFMRPLHWPKTYSEA